METLKIFNDDSKGVALSLDLLLALIPLTLVLGLVAANMGNIMYETQDTIYRSSLERVAADTTNTLLKTSGDPYNWETNPSQVNVVGLAQYDPTNEKPIEYTLSTKKMALLKSSLGEQAIQNIIGDQYGFYIVLTPINSDEIIWNLSSTGTSKESAKDVVKIERNVLYTEFSGEVVSSIKNAGHDYGRPKDYEADKPFPTSQYDLEIYDYYILIFNRGVTSTSVWINQYEVMSENDFKGHDKYSNWTMIIPEDYLKDGINPEDNYLTLKKVASNPNARMDAYVVQVPKGTSPDDIESGDVLPKSYLFQFYAWTK